MPKLTPPEIAYEARSAGFAGKEIAIATAIALAESGGNTDAFNGRPPDLSYGLWQINMFGRLGPERREKFGIDKNEFLFDGGINARAARKIFQEQGWNAWSVYKSRRYMSFMGTATQAAANPTPAESTASPESQLPDTDPRSMFDKLMGDVRDLVLRTAGFVGGGVLIILAIVLYAKGKK